LLRTAVIRGILERAATEPSLAHAARVITATTATNAAARPGRVMRPS
jgi:hypothetical protein